MVDYLPEHNVVFLGHRRDISSTLIETILSFPDPMVFVWGRNYPPEARRLCLEKGIDFTFVEDGFLRGMGLGVAKSRPLSLCMDRQGLHFDRSSISDLEALLAGHDFAGDAPLMEAAHELHSMIVKANLTKYNMVGSSAEMQTLEVSAGYILVLGQVEDDASIALGMPTPMTNNDLVRRAAEDNPGMHIVFRPHPEVAVVPKPHYSDPREVAHLCHIAEGSEPLGMVLARASKVYTMTSLAGFEAALRGLPVRVFGTPFYAGWGFTDDVEAIARRTRRLSPLQVLAGAYILYPRYFDPETNRPIGAMQAIRALASSLPEDVR